MAYIAILCCRQVTARLDHIRIATCSWQVGTAVTAFTPPGNSGMNITHKHRCGKTANTGVSVTQTALRLRRNMIRCFRGRNPGTMAGCAIIWINTDMIEDGGVLYTTRPLSLGGHVWIQSDGTNWHVVG